MKPDRYCPTELSARIRGAFKTLRKRGYFARMNFWCCQSCGWAGVPSSRKDKVVFYHNQDNTDLQKGEPFCLSWSGNNVEIKAVLESHGIRVDSIKPGDTTKRIRVLGPEPGPYAPKDLLRHVLERWCSSYGAHDEELAAEYAKIAESLMPGVMKVAQARWQAGEDVLGAINR